MKVIKFAPGLVPVLKHGEHDQKTHGSWATGGSSWVNAPSHGKEITETAYRGVVLEATKNSKEPTNEEILKTLENRWARGEKPGEVLGQYWSSNEKVALDSSTGDNSQSFWWSQSGVLGQLQPEVIYGVVFEAGIHRAKRDTTNPFYLPNEKGVDAPTLDNIVSLKGKLIKRTKTDSLYEPKIETVREFDIPYDVKILSPKSLAVTKHGEHDQSSHGNWADGVEGGSGLSHQEVYRLQNMSDSLVRKVYEAEGKFQPEVQRQLPKPFPPNNRGEYASSAEYDKAYKAYSKAFDEWCRESTKNIKSTSGEKHLDGSKAGIQNYVNDVTSSDWFVERFGNGGVFGTPKVSLASISAAGQYSFGTKNGVGYSKLTIDKGHSQAEPVILHELAHYATAISINKPHAGHGVEFARNYVYMASKVMGPEYAAGLESAFREAGVPIG